MTAATSSLALPETPIQAAADPAFWRDRRVFLTGHTGFKGAWLSLWLQSLGAQLTGFSLQSAPTQPSLYELARVEEGMQSVGGDVRDFPSLAQALERARPEVVLHMAAQSLVRRSYVDPRETYEVNLMGTVNLLEAVRRQGAQVRAVVIVTSDKCYENREWEWAYREHERMGGHDPYSNSKGCAELVTDAYRRSFFASSEAPRVASARAGNVIGGGDWSKDRLLADLMRGALTGEAVYVRNPHAVRPWQHALNPLSGYLRLAQALWSSQEYARGWNFGPPEEDAQPVGALVERIAALWPEALEWRAPEQIAEPEQRARAAELEQPAPHEAHYLKLDSSLARAHLGWRPRWGLDEGLKATVRWYRGLVEGEDMRRLTVGQIEAFQQSLAVPA